MGRTMQTPRSTCKLNVKKTTRDQFMRRMNESPFRTPDEFLLHLLSLSPTVGASSSTNPTNGAVTPANADQQHSNSNERQQIPSATHAADHATDDAADHAADHVADDAADHVADHVADHAADHDEKIIADKKPSATCAADEEENVIADEMSEDEDLPLYIPRSETDEDDTNSGASIEAETDEEDSKLSMAVGGEAGEALPPLTESETVLRPTSFTCNTCGESFDTIKGIQRHRQSHLPARGPHAPPTCCHCDLVLPSRYQLKKHLRQEHPEKTPTGQMFPCTMPGCGQSFRSRPQRRHHLSAVHPNRNRITGCNATATCREGWCKCKQRCSNCKIVVKGGAKAMRKHEGKHVNRQCAQCGKIFNWQPDYVSHLKGPCGRGAQSGNKGKNKDRRSSSSAHIVIEDSLIALDQESFLDPVSPREVSYTSPFSPFSSEDDVIMPGADRPNNTTDVALELKQGSSSESVDE